MQTSNGHRQLAVRDILPASSDDHELNLVRCLVWNPDMCDVVRLECSPHDFLDLDLAGMFESMLLLREVNFPTRNLDLLWPKLRQMLPDSPTMPSLRVIISKVVTGFDARYHAIEIRRASDLRRQLAITDRWRDLISDRGADPRAILDSMEAALSELRESEPAEAITIEKAAAEVVDEIEQEAKVKFVPGVFSGLAQIDGKIGSFREGELVILAARPGVGKTSLALQIAMHNANKDRHILFVSLEMTSRELAQREVCRLAGIDNKELRRGGATLQHVDQARAILPEFAGLPFSVWAPHSATMPQIRAMAKIENASNPLRLVVVDYIGLVKPHDYRIPRHEQVARVSRDLKALSKEIKCPVLALCQLNREAEKSTPTLANLRESGSIEQDADMVIFIDHAEADKDNPAVFWSDIIVAKHRHGPRGKFRIQWKPESTCFIDEPSVF